MQTRSILYLGNTDAASTSAHRANAIERLGHKVLRYDPRSAIPRGGIWMSAAVRCGFGIYNTIISRDVLKYAKNKKYDVLWVNGGAEISPTLLHRLSSKAQVTVCYNNDDPFGGRDGRKWRQFIKCLPLYDLVAVVRDENVEEAKRFGARNVERVYMSYDPVAHDSSRVLPVDMAKWSSDVAFIGSWMPERGPFLARLIELGVPLAIWGARWDRAREWGVLRTAARGPALATSDYVRAIYSSKIAIGLLSKGNRDLYTTRSSEVPYIGGAVLCAERTSEHEKMFKDGEEAVFWDSAEECAQKCLELLREPARRQAIVARAHLRVQRLGISSDEVVAKILSSAMRVRPEYGGGIFQSKS